MADTRYVFHMGPFKTGSTYLQHCLTSARDALAAQGILYPTAFISPANKTMHIPLRNAAGAGKLAEIQGVFRTLEAAGHATIVFSCEHFIELNAEKLAVLRNATGGRPIEIVYYLRRWSDRLPSLWGQDLRMGGTLTLPQYCMQTLHAPAPTELVDYAIAFDRLAGVFGREALRIVPYSAQTDAKDDIFTAFCRDILGLAETPTVAQQGDTLWGALDFVQSEIVRALNTLHAARDGVGKTLPRTQFFKLYKQLDLSLLTEAIEADKAELLLDDSHACFAPARARLLAYADRVVAAYRDAPMLPPRARQHSYAGGAYLLRDEVTETLQEIYGQLVRDEVVEQFQSKRLALRDRKRAERRAERAQAASLATGAPHDNAGDATDDSPSEIPHIASATNAAEPRADGPEAALRAALRGKTARQLTKPEWVEMFPKLEQLHEAYPEYLPAYAQHIEGLLHTGRKARALRLAERALARAPDALDIRLAYVTAALAAGEHAAAQAQIGRLESEHPRNQSVSLAKIQLLMETNETAQADTLAHEIVERSPSSFRAWKAYARIAAYQGDWQGASDRWEAARPHFPDQQARIDQQVKAARFQLDLQPSPPPEASAADPPAEPELFARFESLGGQQTGCEFGLVQRRFGFESLGLLRWASIGVDALIDGLDAGFDGIGSEAQTFLVETKQEYGLRDRRYGFFTHTFVNRKDMPEDKMLAQSCRRLKFLRSKLLEDLQSGEKIFAYKLGSDSGAADASRLFVALRKHGPGMLLCLGLADEANPPGSWQSLEPGLFLGYIGNFMSSAESKALDAASYEAICRGIVEK